MAQRLDQDLGASYAGLVSSQSASQCRIFLEPFNFFICHSFLPSSPTCIHLHAPFMCQGLGHVVKKELIIRAKMCTCNPWNLEEALWADGAPRRLGEIKTEVFTWLTLSWTGFPQSTRWRQRTGMPIKDDTKLHFSTLPTVVWKKEYKLWSQALPLSSCGTLGNLPLLSEPSFSDLYNGPHAVCEK